MANKITTFFSFQEEGNGLKKVAKDVKEVDGAVNKLKVGFKSSVEEFKKSNAAQAAAIGAASVAAYKAIGIASDLNESVNAVTLAYGHQSDEVLALSENAVESAGLSKRAFNEAAVSVSAFVEDIAAIDGSSTSEALDEITTRAADFGSALNLTTEESLAKFRSGLAGESEPLKQFGINLSAAEVNAYAAANGIGEVGKELTETEKVQARWGLLLQETNKYAGDWANTSDELAGSQKKLKAEAENLAASAGEALAPALETVVTGLNSLIDVLDALKVTDALEWFGDLEDHALSFGRGLRRALDEDADKNWAIIEAFENAERAARNFDKTQLNGLSTWQEAFDMALQYAEGIEGLEDPVVTASLLANEYKTEVLDVAAAQAEAEAATKAAKKENALANVELKKLNAQYDDLGPAVDDTTDSLEDQTAAMERQRRVTDQLYSATLQLVGGDIAVREAQRQATQAMDEFNQSTDRTDDIVDQATEAQLRAASAAADYRVQQLEASGANVTAQQRANILRAELQNLAGNLDGPVRDALLRYIGELNRIPSVIDTQLRLRVTGANVTLGGQPINGGRYIPGEDVPRFDSGGIIPGPIGSPQLVVAHGGETVLPTHKKSMTGGVTLNVYAGIGTDGAQVGRQIVQALENFYRSGGRPPRSA